MKEIPLTHGYVSLVDDEDYEELSKYKWHVLKSGNRRYAQTHISYGRGFSRSISMHTYIMNTPEGFVVDHRHGNGLDNRKENLRICTQKQNKKNSIKTEGFSSVYNGVGIYNKVSGRWRSRIMIDGKPKHLGFYSNELDAALAYDKAARIYFGEFARPNFDKDLSPRRILYGS